MRRAQQFRVAGLLAGLSLAGTAQAQVNIFAPGILYNASTVDDVRTTGLDMSGMRVSWVFSDLTTGFGDWGEVGGGNCGIKSGGLSVLLDCTTSSGSVPWEVRNFSGAGLRSITFNGAPSGTVFDCGWDGASCIQSGLGPFEGTAGSSLGLSFQKHSGGSAPQLGAGVYRNLVGIGGAAPVGDLYAQFGLLFDDLGSGLTYQFWVDTDHASALAPAPTVVPEPRTYALLLGGLAMLTVLARRTPRAG
jgi:hypothetical protein